MLASNLVKNNSSSFYDMIMQKIMDEKKNEKQTKKYIWQNLSCARTLATVYVQ